MPGEEATESTAASTTVAPVAAPSGGGIKTAAEVIAKVTAPETPAKDAKGKFVAAAKPTEPARRVEKLEATAKPTEAPTAAPEPEDDASIIAKARFHLQHGNVAKFIDTVVGDMNAEGIPDAVREALGRKLGVSSKQWEEIRKYEQGAKRKLAAREQELSGVVERLKAEYAPLHQARAAYEAGDYDAAFKAAFGEDAADYQRKIISQRVGKNPEIEKLRAELEERDKRIAAKEREQAEARAAAEQAEAQRAYMSEMQGQLVKSEDPEIAAYATKPQFIQRCFAVMQRVYQTQGVEADLADVVEYVRANQVSVAEARSWAPAATAGAAPANAVRASAPPEKPPAAKAPARALKQSQAAEATGKPRKETSAEVRERYRRMMEQSDEAAE